MSRKALTIATPLLVAAALAPATASATELGGAPTLRVADAAGTVQLRFAVDESLPQKTRITVDGAAVDGLRRAGRHGHHLVYTARAGGDLEVGRKYTVRFRFGSATITRQVKVHARR